MRHRIGASRHRIRPHSNPRYAQRIGLGERDLDQAITALKKGAHLLKYGRRGKPKFCPFRLSPDESMLVWYYGKEEKQLELRHVSKIIPGQRTAIFQRYPRPEKEYQSFSLMYNDRSLDLICKDKDEAEIWFVGLKALISRSGFLRLKTETRSDSISSDGSHNRRISPFGGSLDLRETQRTESLPQSRLGKAFADIVSYTASSKNLTPPKSINHTTQSSSYVDNTNGRSSASETVRISLSSAVSSSSQGSCHEDFEALGDVFIWGEGTGDGILGGGVTRIGKSGSAKTDSYLPKRLESTVVLDIHGIACGSRHAALVTKQGDMFSWGEESGGRLGHGADSDVSNPKLIDYLSGMKIEMIACGEYHTCAVTLSGDLYTWGDGSYNTGLLGHGSKSSHWLPKKVSGLFDGIHVMYVSCGPWHTAAITSSCRLFTFGDGTFGALGHGDNTSNTFPKEVVALKGLRTVRVACGVWHTAAVVEVTPQSPTGSGPSDGSLSGKLFTWGNGDNGQLGHGDKGSRLSPECVASLVDIGFHQVACGYNMTVALATSGRVYSIGDRKTPTLIKGKISDSFVQEISCGSHHIAILTSKTEVYTWGKGTKGQLGHGDNDDRDLPTLVEFLKDKQVKSIACGSNFTAVTCFHKSMTCADNSICSGCHCQFNFRRKRRNCYNCGLVYCKACSSRKSLKASLAPSMNKPYRVCDDCFTKLQKTVESSSSFGKIPKPRNGNISINNKVSDLAEGETTVGSRFSSMDSFSQIEGSRSSKHRTKGEINGRRVFPLPVGNGQKVSVSLLKPPISKNHVLGFAVPTSRTVSRATSPLSGKTSSFRSPTQMRLPPIHTDDSKHNNNGSLSHEIMCLKAQVEELASKSQVLEAELDKKSRQLTEAKALAADESEKYRAANDVIMSLTAQLKKMGKRVAVTEGSNPSSNAECNGEQIANVLRRFPNLSLMSSVASHTESIDNLTNQNLPNGTKAQPEKAERVIQGEPGVFISVSTLPGGGYELKRIRFSRKRFSEEQAQKWWSENGTRVCEKHNIQITD